MNDPSVDQEDCIVAVIKVLDLLPTTQTDGLIITANLFSFAVVWKHSCFFLLDSHARDENGYEDGEGSACCLRFDCAVDLACYIKSSYECPNSDWSFVRAQEVYSASMEFRKEHQQWSRPSVESVQWTDNSDRQLNLPYTITNRQSADESVDDDEESFAVQTVSFDPELIVDDDSEDDMDDDNDCSLNNSVPSER